MKTFATRLSMTMNLTVFNQYNLQYTYKQY